MISNNHQFMFALCLDARSDSGLRVSCGLERLCGGSGWRCNLYHFHFSGACRIATCGSRPARSRPATRLAQEWRASAATNTDSVTYRRSTARLPRDTGPGVRPHTVSAQANCDDSLLPPVCDSLSPRQSVGSGAHSVGSDLLCRPVRVPSL